jgi:putative endonuclease
MTSPDPVRKQNHTMALGRWGEKVAESVLRKRGLQVIDRNYRTPYGEIDLVACDLEGLVFVEVKTRTNQAFGRPEEAITARKAGHLVQAVAAYLQNQPGETRPWRIDVIAILGAPNQPNPEIAYFENAVG